MKREGQEQFCNVEGRRDPGGGAPAAAAPNAAAPIATDTPQPGSQGLMGPARFTHTGFGQRASGFGRGPDGCRLEACNRIGAR